MRHILLISIFASTLILWGKENKNQEWVVKIYFDVRGEWNSMEGGKGNYELKMLFEGWLFRDNGDYGISYLKDSVDEKTYYWKLEKLVDGKKMDISDYVRPYFEGGVSVRIGGENLILLRISSKNSDFKMIFPSSKGFGIVKNNDEDYDRFVVSGSNKLSFRDEDLKKEYFKNNEWEWVKKDANSYFYHKVKTLMIIKPNF